MSSYLTDEQVAQMLRPIRSERVGKIGKYSHVEAYEIRAHLNRIFGFARWSADVIDQQQVFESSAGDEGKRWTVCYRTTMRLTVCAPDGTVLATYTEGATGDAQNQPTRSDAHDQALKTSESQALKRCASNLGDQFGLSLYNKGSLRPLVGRTLLTAVKEEAGEVDSHITAPLAPENDTTETPQRETSSPGPTQESAGRAESAPETADESPAAEKPTDPDDEFTLILAQLNLLSTQTPATAMQIIKDCMERSTRAHLGTRRVPDTNLSLSAHLQRMLRYAASRTDEAVSA